MLSCVRFLFLLLFLWKPYTSLSQLTHIGMKVGMYQNETNDDFIKMAQFEDLLNIYGSYLETNRAIDLTWNQEHVNAGIFCLYQIHPSLRFQTEINFITRGISYMNNFYNYKFQENFTYRKDYKLTNIFIPLKFKKDFIIKNSLGLTFFAGPSISFMIKSQLKYTVQSSVNDSTFHSKIQKAGYSFENYTRKIKANFLNLGGSFGLGLFYKFKNNWIIQGEVEYYLGFSKLLTVYSETLSSNYNLKNNTTMFTLSIGCPIK